MSESSKNVSESSKNVSEWTITFIALAIMVALFGKPFFYLLVIFLAICFIAGLIAGIIEGIRS